MTRAEMIEWLIDSDMDYVNSGNGLEWLRMILATGFDGYDNEPDEVLRREILERNEDAFREEYHEEL